MPALDEVNPATLSRRIVTGVLRGELRFDGLVFTDDLDMKAISGRTDAGARRGLGDRAPGCDVVLMCGTDSASHASALEALVRAVEHEEIPRTRVDDAVARQRRAKERFAALSGSTSRPRLAADAGARAAAPWSAATSTSVVADEMRRFA